MERTSTLPRHFSFKHYVMLMKPGIIMGNIITAAGGFALASKGHVNPTLFFAMLLGLALVIGSACVFNNYIDRELDQKMVRTRNRPLAKGVISTQNALVFGTVIGLLGTLILALGTNLLTTAIALFGVFVYVALYSFSKYRTHYGTLIGSIAGAVPPVIGYCAVTGRLDLGALIWFLMIVCWQMPHFFAIAIYRLKDYEKGGIPTLPLTKGMRVTKIQMTLYTIAFVVASSMLTLCGYTGALYLSLVLLLGGGWLFLALKGFKCSSDQRWARKMFIFSLVVVMTLCTAIPFVARPI